MLGLDNMLIKTKLKLIVLIASMGILILGFFKVYSLIGELKTESSTVQKAEDTKSISAIIHEIQKERGLSGAFVSSGGKINGEKIKEQRVVVDNKFAAYVGARSESDSAKELLQIQNTLKEKRVSIDSFMLSAPDTLATYTVAISNITDSLNKNILSIDDTDSMRSGIAYGYLETSKEALGQMRAGINMAFAEGSFPDGAFSRLVASKSLFDRNINRFTKLATKQNVDLLKTKLYTPEYEKMQSMIKIAMEKQKEGNFGVEATAWFETASKNLDNLKSAQDEIMNQIIDEATANKTAVLSQLIFALLLATGLMAILIAISLLTTKSIESSIGQITKGFKGLIASGSAGTKLEVHSKDEVAEIGKLFNEYMAKVNHDIEIDGKAINQLNEIANLAATGIFAIRISESGASTQVRQAISSVNTMLNSIEDAASKITKGMIEFASANYQYSLETTGYAGCIGSLSAGLTALGNSNSELFAMITISGEQLETHAQDLTREAEALSSAANEQAANLEQTAAALEEMTSNIHSATDKAASMAKSAGEAKKATLTGAKMADETAKAMVEIAEATKSINEAVAIIENIAFQTNILSLNAAVEAATAGEAGKGFAVVAQEVRNLANRSAEAAKQIKGLTETAKTKSEDGLKISDDMNIGFKTIAEKIDQTARMVEEVASASKEQMQGISQINDAVTQLDQVTQQNAAAANGVSHMSQIVLDLAGSLLDAAGRTKFDAVKRKMVCNMDMIFDTTKLKLDHIKFKETNYTKVKTSATSFAVTDQHSCALGKWLDAHKSELQTSSAWLKMEVAHAHVHSKVKEFCDRGIGTNPNAASLSTLAKEIEGDTLSVFECLDEFKVSLCEGSNCGNSKQDMISF